MKVSELIRELETFDQDLKVHVFRAEGDEGTPYPILVKTKGRPDRVTIPAKEDD